MNDSGAASGSQERFWNSTAADDHKSNLIHLGRWRPQAETNPPPPPNRADRRAKKASDRKVRKVVHRAIAKMVVQATKQGAEGVQDDKGGSV